MKRKAGGQPLSPELAAIIANPDSYLFAEGRTLADYFIRDGAIGFMVNGREYDWLIDHEELARSLCVRLIELGVEQRK
ncbi:hypothetical protein ABI_27690 [Asticcacaulis biprosthecium C19]|uniref:Uncharacterized protein n=1 Tax=Asticcacaulis biprosthecium C19 TaxID=715226 RepID=F4QMB3_9CAUL|nr:hypothetical protein [Asticcacaulis biprosthecium]EGF91354.1 hypothetical protein ABI_27690 [Asticcacaulis biprosthecium C19]